MSKIAKINSSPDPGRHFPPVGPVVKASVTRAEDPGFEFRLRRDFSASSHTNDLKLALQWLPSQAPGIVGSALRLVDPVSVYCDLVRWKI